MGSLTQGGYAGERASENRSRACRVQETVSPFSEEGVLEMSNSEGGRMRRMIVLVLTFALGLLAPVPSASAGDNFVARCRAPRRFRRGTPRPPAWRSSSSARTERC